MIVTGQHELHIRSISSMLNENRRSTEGCRPPSARDLFPSDPRYPNEHARTPSDDSDREQERRIERNIENIGRDTLNAHPERPDGWRPLTATRADPRQLLRLQLPVYPVSLHQYG